MSGQNYVDLVFLRALSSKAFDERFGSEWLAEVDTKILFRQVIREALAGFGYSVGETYDGLADQNLAWLLESNAFLREGDSYTGIFYKVRTSVKNATIGQYLEADEAARRIEALGSAALERALGMIARENDWVDIKSDDDLAKMVHTGVMQAPASDRIVTFDHNQSSQLEAATTAVIDALSIENSIDGDVDLKDLYLGQLRASRELIRAGSVRMYLLYEAAVRALVVLIDRYKGQAIGEAAKYLLRLLLDQVFKP